MKALEALTILGDFCASQRGMFTSAQAQSAGVGRMTLSRLADGGQIEQVLRGVYRAAAAPVVREEDVYAAWLATDPAVPAWERPVDGTGCTASLNTAAWLHGLGELKPEPLTFSCPKRRQTRNPNLRFLRRNLEAVDVSVVGGIPVTTPARTVLDLIDYGEDLSLVASVMADAEVDGRCSGLRDEVDRRAVRRGFADGFPLYSYLKGIGH